MSSLGPCVGERVLACSHLTVSGGPGQQDIEPLPHWWAFPPQRVERKEPPGAFVSRWVALCPACHAAKGGRHAAELAAKDFVVLLQVELEPEEGAHRSLTVTARRS